MSEQSVGPRPKVHRLPQHVTPEHSARVSWLGIVVCVSSVVMLWAVRGGERTIFRQVLPFAETQTVLSTSVVTEAIPVQDDKGEIVGQLAKMPADVERGASVDATAAIDQKSGIELMNIISKY